MSTRAAIARLIAAEPPRREGVYHHWDGYPSFLGRWLFLTIRQTFRGDAEAFLQFALSHQAGWSHIVHQGRPIERNGTRYDLPLGHYRGTIAR